LLGPYYPFFEALGIMEKIIVRGERRANVNEIIELTDAMEQNPS
jgi:hypothetical protein